MLDTSYISLIQSNYSTKYTDAFNAPLKSLSDISPLLAKSKSDDTSSSDYADKIVDVAESDAQNDIKNNNLKSWKKSEDYLKLKDEYVAGSSEKDSLFNYGSSISEILNKTVSSFTYAHSDSYLNIMNKVFSKAMNETIERQTRSVAFDFKYSQAYNAYKATNSAKNVTSSLNISV